ncbi:MAG: Spx/MgsR family RNA polymerase-binding regulatory protein [Spirulina sp. SIO3F2]|nr:Spx/MgsR family RNA polymerase-binding regulatory protein [Spirulina sp. SIO3F2]
MTTLKLYGIPNCGTCKKARQWLDDRAITYEFINTKESPPTLEQIKTWVETLGSKPMRNTSGQAYRALGPERSAWNDDDWITAFSENAMLLKRPLFVRDGQALKVGFRGSDAEIQSQLGL